MTKDATSFRTRSSKACGGHGARRKCLALSRLVCNSPAKARRGRRPILAGKRGLHWSCGPASFTVKKLECLKQAFRLNTLAWNNEIGLSVLFCWSAGPEVMINRDSWGYSYLTVRGEILGFVKDEPLRKHLPRMFSLIKNESQGIEED